MGKWFVDYRKEVVKEYTFDRGKKSNVKVTVELYYSVLHILSGNPRWYCRAFANNIIAGESYGKTKFEAYKNAMNIFN